MPNLLRKPFGSHGKVHEITPQAAVESAAATETSG